MNFKNLANKAVNFIADRLKELIGVTLIVISTFIGISLVSYSPEDPNFIYSDNTEIENILGFQGSFTSDLLFQSLGLMSILLCLTIFFTGINIIRFKKILLILENLFFSIIYIISGSFFLSIFYSRFFFVKI